MLELSVRLLVLAAVTAGVRAQGSGFALQFRGAGAASHDRVLIHIDDDHAGPDASAPCDVGSGSFTIEMWLRGTLAGNPTSHSSGDVAIPGTAWRKGNVLVDRSIAAGSHREFGVSVGGGYVRFGTGAGDSGGVAYTIEGNTEVLDDRWHHIACVRDSADGTASIYVDGVLDFASAPGTSTADLSYPDSGVGPPTSRLNPYLVVGAAKPSGSKGPPSFDGFVDELRIWTTARSAQDIAASYYRVVPSDSPGLVAYYRIEEGDGACVADSSAQNSPAGDLQQKSNAGTAWSSAASGPDAVAPVVNTTLPAGFARTTLVDGRPELTSLACAPDGRIFVGEHAGRVDVVTSGVLLPDALLTIPCQSTEQAGGLLGLALDRDFATNGFLYAYYTTIEPRNRVSRFTVVGDTADLGSEFVVWQNTELAGEDHLGGGIDIGLDGALYISTGDQYDSQNAQDLGNEHGKLLRVLLDGSVPLDNPFAAIPAAAPTIFARGLRNPFRISVDALTGEVLIGDVGGNKAPAWEELHSGLRAANYGWPFQEGAVCSGLSCSQAVAPLFAYRHDDPNYFVGGTNAAIILGPVYRASAFPAEYLGNVFIGDYANQWIRRVVFDAAGQVVAAPMFLAPPYVGPVVDLDVGSDGALYFVTCAVGSTQSEVVRIHFDGANQPPVARAFAAPSSGAAPLSVSFLGSTSFDPDHGPGAASCAWDFGDGSFANAADTTHVFSAPGTYRAQLTVDDGATSTTSDPVTIVVGNPPLPTISSPAEGALYRAGDDIVFSGSALDSEDGALAPGKLSWSADLVHGNHRHPEPNASVVGSAAGTLHIPTSGHTPEDTYYELRFAATDSDGLTSTVVRELHPVAAPMVFTCDPPGIPLFVDGQAEETPRLYTSVSGFVHDIRAQQVYVLAGVPWVFHDFSDGGAIRHFASVPDGGASICANYTPRVEHALSSVVDELKHCAQFRPLVGQSFGWTGAGDDVRCGRDGSGTLQVGLQVDLAIPHDALILSAQLELTAAEPTTGSPVVTLWSYASIEPDEFVDGSLTALTAWAPLNDDDVRWALPSVGAEIAVQSPDLTKLVQPCTTLPGWTIHSRLGLVIDGAPTEIAGWFAAHGLNSAAPPRLNVSYVTLH